jgi:hypothetical protein
MSEQRFEVECCNDRNSISKMRDEVEAFSIRLSLVFIFRDRTYFHVLNCFSTTKNSPLRTEIDYKY